MENLHISSNKKYLMKGDKPFFWLGDTAWMLFTNISYEEALHHEGSGEMLHLKKLMESVDFTSGKMADELLLSGQKEKYGRISVFAGSDYVIAYDYSCSEFTLDVSAYSGKSMYWMSPVTGVYSYIGKCVGYTFTARKPERYEEDNADRVLVIS